MIQRLESCGENEGLLDSRDLEDDSDHKRVGGETPKRKKGRGVAVLRFGRAKLSTYSVNFGGTCLLT